MMETPFHFRCERCEARWSADDQSMSWKHYCPHCGSELKDEPPILTKLRTPESKELVE